MRSNRTRLTQFRTLVLAVRRDMLRTSSTTLLAIAGPCLMLVQGVHAQSSESDSESERTFATASIEPGERPYSQIDRDISAFIARAAQASTPADRNAAIQDLCAVLEELKRDPRLDRSETLTGYKAKLVSRLGQLRRVLEAEQDREARAAEREERRAAAQRRARERAAGTRGDLDDNESFPEQGQQLGWQESQNDDATGAAAAMAAQWQYLSASAGGGSSIVMRGGGHYGGGSVASNASDLIELIHRTIEPDHWDVNGGPGTIFFYQPLNALVVRATSEVHSGLGRSLDELRRAGGR